MKKFSRGQFSRVVDHILAEKYEDRRGWGYLVAEARPEKLTGKFIEKQKHVEAITDPFGETQNLEFLTYEEVAFSIQTKFPQLQIEDPPRGLGPFLSAIGESVNLEVSIGEIQISPMDWVEHFRRRFPSTSVVKAVINDIILSNTASGMIVLSGSEDVQRFSDEFTRGRKFRIGAVQIAFRHLDEDVKFEVNDVCRVKILQGGDQHSAPFFRDVVSALEASDSARIG